MHSVSSDTFFCFIYRFAYYIHLCAVAESVFITRLYSKEKPRKSYYGGFGFLSFFKKKKKYFQTDIKSSRKLFALFLNEESAHNVAGLAVSLFREAVPFISYDYSANNFLVATQHNYRCLKDMKSWFYAMNSLLLCRDLHGASHLNWPLWGE